MQCLPFDKFKESLETTDPFCKPLLFGGDYQNFLCRTDEFFIDWFIDYTEKAYSTCGDSSWNEGEFYFPYGIREESGELCGIIKRVLRGDFSFSDEKFKDLIIKESGDVLWYSSQILFKSYTRFSKEIVSFSEEQKHNFKKFIYDSFYTGVVSNNLMKNIFHINSLACQIFINYDMFRSIKEEIFSILFNIDAIAHIFNYDIEYIGEKNYEKLQDRKERNVIKGSGNNR